MALSSPGDEGPADILYESRTTRVSRHGNAGAAVVVKQALGADAARRLGHEAAILAQLAGLDGVVQLAAQPQPPGALVLQDCSATVLARLLRTGPLDLAKLLTMAPQLARCVAAVHRAGVIHRDINPANILLTPALQPVLIDFDVAMLADQHHASEPEDQIVGTLAYLPPEQTGRTGYAVDQRADLYALGATLYQMATGKVPFETQDTLQLIHDHLVREPVAPSQLNPRVPRSLSGIILRLLAKAPEQRYQSAEGLLHDLSRLRDEFNQGAGAYFELGERDFPARLPPPARLVGRDAEMALLRNALADARNTPRRTVLIEGAAGVGKSALIDQLRPAVAAAGGWFIQGKFDQYQKGAATSGAVTQAGRALGRLLLAQPLEELAAQRQRILDVLGRSAALITRLSPEFALLLGDQPEAPEVDPQYAELQVQHATLNLLGAIASPARPLVVVLDDLQWAGALSLRGIGHMMNEPALKGVLLIGTYRAEELDADHVLTQMLAQWRQQPQPPLEMALAALPAAGMGELIGQMLRLAPGRAHALAQAVGELTGGNPFDTVEMINALRRDGIIYLDAAGWQWNEARVRHFVGRGNVVDLLAARIARLPTASRELLEFMSCLGNEVESALLGAAAGLGDGQLREALRAPLDDGLLLADNSRAQPSVHFRHDRVQQAVLGAMDDSQRARRQLAMARRLAREPDFEGDAAQQYLACTGELHDTGEQRHVARLFYALAQKLTGTATYSLAERYLAAASRLLAAIGAPGDRALRGAIDSTRHAALYSLGRLDESDPLYASMQSHMDDPLALVEPTCLQMRSLFMRGQIDAAKKMGLGLLRQLGLAVPQDYAAPDTEERLNALQAWIRQDSGIDHSTRPQIQDQRLLAIAKLLGRMARPAYFDSDKNAFQWLLLESQRLWAEHGPCAELVASLGRMTGMLIGGRGDFQTAHDIARHVLTVGEALGYEPQTSEARFIFSACAGHWFLPMEEVVRDVRLAFEGVVASGDLSYAGYVHAVLITDLLEIAPTIEASAAEVDAGIELCQRAGNLHAGAQHLCERQLLRALRGQTVAPGSFDDAQFNEAAFLVRMGKLPYLEHTYAECRALCGLIMGDAGLLTPNANRGMALAGDLSSYYMAVYAHLFSAMARAWQLQQSRRDGHLADPQALAELETCRHWLAGRAADQPYNYLHLLRLVEAEQAWALGDLWRTAVVFDAAMGEAASRQRPWHRALITERAGLFKLAQGMSHEGRKLVSDACELYESWGASAKVERMAQEHAFLRTRTPARMEDTRAALPARQALAETHTGTGTFSPDALDLVGVLRASQALSSETSLERLATRVSEVLAALSGATHVLVLSWHDEQWWLLAPGPGESSISAAWAAECGLLPLSAVRYAERTNEPLLVDDACSDDRFARDPYFAALPFCSLLVAPISSQGSARAMVLLENRLGRAAFNAQRLDAVMLIAGQLAVSLANAQLYESLEQRVQARTRELEQTQAELVAFARRAGKAEIANNVLHNVGNVLNSVNVSASVVRRTISESRAQGLTRAVALMNEHEHDLPGFIGQDPRGRALLGYFNELVGALQQERINTLGDLDRLARSVEHITYVVAAQQSHSGPSSVMELVQPDELMEEALHLSEQAIARAGVTVVRQYVEVMATTLDKQRLLQILVNLIGNAAQAMERMPGASRRLTLAAQRIQDGNGEWLHITVQDEGEGIAPANLTRIFAHGFTTRQEGHGFGLHSAALSAMEMGGRLTAHSEGPGRGAVFTLELPILAPMALPPAAAA